MHLIIDGYVKDPKKIEDREVLHRFLDTYPAKINMTKVSTPQVSEYKSPQSKGQGISGFVLLAESHISLHVYPEECYINLDIFSCTEFDAGQAIEGLENQFGLIDLKSRVLDRPHPE